MAARLRDCLFPEGAACGGVGDVEMVTASGSVASGLRRASARAATWRSANVGPDRSGTPDAWRPGVDVRAFRAKGYVAAEDRMLVGAPKAGLRTRLSGGEPPSREPSAGVLLVMTVAGLG